MKKHHLLWLLAVLFSLPISADDRQAFYVYRNDGVINAFFTYEMDSIRYSHYDIDSIWHENIQVQEIWTEDSVYRIPLSVIDSASFITPRTILQPGVKEISSNLMDYVLGSDSMRIFLDVNTPQSVMPAIGERIVTTEMSEKFPIGFAGQVESVQLTTDGYVVDCSLVPLTEIFEQFTYYASKHSETVPADNASYLSRRKAAINPIDYSGDKQFTLPQLTWSAENSLFSVDPLPDLAVKLGTEFSVSIKAGIGIKTFLQVNQKDGIYYNGSINGDITVEEAFAISGGVNRDPNIPFSKFLRVGIAPFVFLYTEPGLAFHLKAQLSTKFSAFQQYKIAGVWDFSTKGQNVLKPAFRISLANNGNTVEGSLNGSVGLGYYQDLGVTVMDPKIVSVKFRTETGFQLQGGLVLFKADMEDAYINTDLYERCEDGNIELDLYRSYSLQSQLGKKNDTIFAPQTYTAKLREWDIVPTFSNTKLVAKSANSAEATVEMEGDCLVPLVVGFSLRDEDDNEVDKYYTDDKFDNGHQRISHTFTNLEENTSYSVYPIIRMLNYDVEAAPKAELDVHQWVKITKFAVTDSVYDKEQSFVHNNEKFTYKFDCAVTVELNTEGKNVKVADWGYAYIDPKGDTAYISLKDFNSPYEDKRYTYYRNDSKSTVNLRGYVIFEGETERYLEAVRVFPIEYINYACDDNNHQHMVDLGLPSGTLWSCMNLGASKPTDVGDYFAFGETKTKERFTDNNYLYYEYNGGNPYYSSIGANISGTTYDPATINWKDGWRMPTLQEEQELLDNCTFEYQNKGDSTGYLVTGPNGNTIFLPLAPVKNNANYGAITYYRSSFISSASLGNIMMAGTEAIRFSETMAPNLAHVCYRYLGAVIRPVKTKPAQ